MKAQNVSSWRSVAKWTTPLALCLASFGCSVTPMGMAMHLAGEAVNDVDAREKAKQCVGVTVPEADAKLGAPIDVLADVHSTRTWRSYSVPMDPLKSSRYVAEVNNGRVIALSKVQRYSDAAVYAATLAVLTPKVKGKTSAQCQSNLEMGPPLLTVRSQKTGRLIQLYDARMVKELQAPHYCILRFSRANSCEEIDLVKAYRADGRDPTAR